ncbi:hypothetical protein YB2330_000688 [Saitoella coloradoensis]
MFNKLTKNVSLKKAFTKVAKGAKKAARSTVCCFKPKEQLEAAPVVETTIADVSAIEQAVIACGLIAEGDHTVTPVPSVAEVSIPPSFFANSTCEEATVMIETVSQGSEFGSIVSVLESVVEASFMEPEASCLEFSSLNSVLFSAGDITVGLDAESVHPESVYSESTYSESVYSESIYSESVYAGEVYSAAVYAAEISAEGEVENVAEIEAANVYDEEEVETVAEIESIVVCTPSETHSMTSAASAAEVAIANAESQVKPITVLNHRLSGDSGIQLDAEPELDMEALLAKLEAENQKIEVIGSVLNKASAMNARLETATRVSKWNGVFGW